MNHFSGFAKIAPFILGKGKGCVMYCSYCGARVSDDAAFCRSCGRAVAGQHSTSPAEKPAIKEPVATKPAGFIKNANADMNEDTKRAYIYAGIIGVLMLITFMPMFALNIAAYHGQYSFLDVIGLAMDANNAASALGLNTSSLVGSTTFTSGIAFMFAICALFWMVALCAGAYFIYRAVSHKDIQSGGPGVFIFLSITVIAVAYIAQAMVANAAGSFSSYVGNLVSPGVGAWLLFICSIVSAVVTSKVLVTTKWQAESGQASCSHCGTRLEDGQTFCEKCGVSVEGDSAPAASATMLLETDIQAGDTDAVLAGGASESKTESEVGKTVVLPTVAEESVSSTRSVPSQDSESSKKPTSYVVIAVILAVIAILLALLVVFMWVGNNSQPAATTSVSTRGSSAATSSSLRKSATTAAENSVTLQAWATGGQRLTGTVRRDESDYVLPDSSTREYSMSELRSMNLTPAEICIAWNEPFAREGYHFGNTSIQEYFEDTSWYRDKGIKPNVTGIAATNNERLRELADQMGGDAPKWKDLVLDNN